MAKKITVNTLVMASKEMKTINTALTLINKKYGEVGPSCKAVNDFLSSEKGKAELQAAGLKKTAWLKEHLSTTPEAFYNAVRRYEESKLTKKEKDKKKADAAASRDKAKKEAESLKQAANAIPTDFGVIELTLADYLKTLSDGQYDTFLSTVLADGQRREAEKTKKAADKATRTTRAKANRTARATAAA